MAARAKEPNIRSIQKRTQGDRFEKNSYSRTTMDSLLLALYWHVPTFWKKQVGQKMKQLFLLSHTVHRQHCCYAGNCGTVGGRFPLPAMRCPAYNNLSVDFSESKRILEDLASPSALLGKQVARQWQSNWLLFMNKEESIGLEWFTFCQSPVCFKTLCWPSSTTCRHTVGLGKSFCCNSRPPKSCFTLTFKLYVCFMRTQTGSKCYTDSQHNGKNPSTVWTKE